MKNMIISFKNLFGSAAEYTRSCGYADWMRFIGIVACGIVAWSFSSFLLSACTVLLVVLVNGPMRGFLASNLKSLMPAQSEKKSRTRNPLDFCAWLLNKFFVFQILGIPYSRNMRGQKNSSFSDAPARVNSSEEKGNIPPAGSPEPEKPANSNGIKGNVPSAGSSEPEKSANPHKNKVRIGEPTGPTTTKELLNKVKKLESSMAALSSLEKSSALSGEISQPYIRVESHVVADSSLGSGTGSDESDQILLRGSSPNDGEEDAEDSIDIVVEDDVNNKWDFINEFANELLVLPEVSSSQANLLRIEELRRKLETWSWSINSVPDERTVAMINRVIELIADLDIGRNSSVLSVVESILNSDSHEYLLIKKSYEKARNKQNQQSGPALNLTAGDGSSSELVDSSNSESHLEELLTALEQEIPAKNIWKAFADSPLGKAVADSPLGKAVKKLGRFIVGLDDDTGLEELDDEMGLWGSGSSEDATGSFEFSPESFVRNDSHVTVRGRSTSKKNSMTKGGLDFDGAEGDTIARALSF